MWLFRKTEWVMLSFSERKIWRRITGIFKVGGQLGIRYGNDWHQIQDEPELSTVILLREL